MIRAVGLGLVAVALGTAPLQCGRSPLPEVRREESAGDALYDLALEFRRRGDEAAAKDTLRFLVERYPSSRRAPAAREELAASSAP